MAIPTFRRSRAACAEFRRGEAAPVLIWINHHAPESAEHFSMRSWHRLFVRPCPLCGVAMQASKSREDLADVDTFQCLSCQTVISERRSAPPRENGSC